MKGTGIKMFLSCYPSVFVIGNEYEIILNTEKNGIFSVEVGEKTYYEEGSGVLSSEKSFAKIRVPQAELDRERRYKVCWRETINRRAYFSELNGKMAEEFDFKPLLKTDGINIYHIADVHYHFDAGIKAASFFGESLDALIVNGDVGEVESEENYLEVFKFTGDIGKGRIPIAFVRGNHDTRGRLAERFTEYFPSNGKNTFYSFDLGPLRGIALDCGEDKDDTHPEYNGVNDFYSFRRRETGFLRALKREERLTFAVSHICPAQTTENSGNCFDIEREVYTEWLSELERLGVRFMLCGHIHRAYVLEKNDKRSLLKHAFPVIVGSEVRKNGVIVGSAINIRGNTLTVRFTDSEMNVSEPTVIELESGAVNRS